MKNVLDNENGQTTAMLQESLTREFFNTLSVMRLDEAHSYVESDKDTNSVHSVNVVPISENKTEKVDSSDDKDMNGEICPKYASICLIVSLVAIAIGSAIAVFTMPSSLMSNILNFKIKNETPLEIPENKIPVLFELPSKSAFSISTALSKCLGLRSSAYNKQLQLIESYEEKSVDFYTANSICNFRDPEERIRMFVVFQNPAVRMFEDYSKVQNMNFTQYLEWPGREDNALVRSILCKTNGQISIADFNEAETFLKDRAIVSITNKYKNIVHLFQRRFRPNLDSREISKCMEAEFKMNLGQARYLRDELLVYLQQMYRSNFYDFSIYQNFASEDDNVFS